VPVNGQRSRHDGDQEQNMGGTGKIGELPTQEDRKPVESPTATVEDDDAEDGDFATPKRDRYGDDDQPL